MKLLTSIKTFLTESPKNPTSVTFTDSVKLRNGTTVGAGTYKVTNALSNTVFMATERGRSFGILRSTLDDMVKKKTALMESDVSYDTRPSESVQRMEAEEKAYKNRPRKQTGAELQAEYYAQQKRAEKGGKLGSDNTETTVRTIRNGEYVRFKDSPTAPVWVKDGYNRESKRYEFHAFDDVNRFVSKIATAKCYVGFTF